MFKSIDISEKLKKKRDFQKSIISSVNQWLWEEERIEEEIFRSNKGIDELDISKLDEDKIFSVTTIQRVCLDYKLRFLDKDYYLDEIPYEAIIELKRIKKERSIEFDTFKILAPARKFKLKDELEDPILFGRINDQEYYLIHKWGNDLSWYKKISAFPFRNINCLIFSILIFSLITGFIVPNNLLSNVEGIEYLNIYRALSSFWIFVFTTSIVLYYWMISKADFSEHVWNSKYL